MRAGRDETLGRALRRQRILIGLGAHTAARLAGLSKRSVLDWEADRFKPSGPALDRLLKALATPERERAEFLARGAPDYARTALVATALGAPIGAGEVLRAMRLRRGETQARVAQRTGVAQGTLARWEGGARAPDAEATARLLAALEATEEECAALSAVPWVEPEDGDPNEIEERLTQAAHRTPLPLRDVALLRIEAELWRRAARDPAADPLLSQTLATRAQQSLLRGALDEIGGLRRRAVRLASLARRPDPAVAAVYAACWVTQRRPGGAVSAARTLARWADDVVRPELRTWFRAAQGMALTRTDEAAGGIALLEDLDRRAAERSWEDVVYHRNDLVEGLIFAGHAERALERALSLGGGASASSLAKAYLGAGQVPPAPVLEAVRTAAASDWVKAYEARQVERGLKEVLQGRRVRFD